MPVYKDEQRGTWFISCYYVDWDGKRRLKKKRGFERRKDAQSYEREFLLKQSKLPTITFGLLVDNYNEDMEHRLRGTTKAVKNYVVQKHFIPFFGNLPLDEITPIHIRKWQSQILVRGYSKTYTKLLNNQLVALFNYAVRFYQLPENPCHKAGTIGTKKADTMQFWTYNEFQLFLQHVTAPPAKLGFQLLFWTGIRIGELLALTATDFNFENQTLSITKNYQVVKGEPHIFEPKTQKSVRKIPLPQALMPVIQDYLQNAPLYWQNGQNGQNKQATERLFPCSKKYFSDAKKRAIKASGLKYIRLHDFRHSHASLLIELGLPVVLISERLGHENINTTLNTYSHLYPNRHADAANMLNNLLAPKPQQMQ